MKLIQREREMCVLFVGLFVRLFLCLSVCCLGKESFMIHSANRVRKKKKEGEGKEYGIERSHNNNKNIMK